MDNASYAEHIVCCLRDSICGNLPYFRQFQDPTQSPERGDTHCAATVLIARTYLLNDLIYNADNGTTTPYRALLQTELPAVFEALGRAREAAESRERREIEIRVDRILKGWLKTAILPAMFVRGLRTMFLMTGREREEDGEGEDGEDVMRLQCRMNGLCNYGSRGMLRMRLKKMKEWMCEGDMRNRLNPVEEKNEEKEAELDPSIDGESLDVSDYEECFFPPSDDPSTENPL